MDPHSKTDKITSELGGLTWFPIRSQREVNLEIERLKFEGISFLRLGVDCAKFNAKKGLEWYDWLVPTLAQSFELELCFDNFFHRPIGIPYRKNSIFEIVEHFIIKHGQHFNLVELWWNPTIRSNEQIAENIFSEDVVFTATWAQHHGKKVGLRGIQTEDFEWITKLIASHFLNTIEYLKLDKETANQWSKNTRFYERTLKGFFAAKGIKTQIKISEIPMPTFQNFSEELAS